MFQDEILWERTAFTKWSPMSMMGLSLMWIEPCIARSRQLTTRLLLGWNKVYACRVYSIFADFICRMKISFQCGCGVLSCIVFIVTQDPKFSTKTNQPGKALKLYTSSAYANGLRNSHENARNTMVIHGVSGSNSILLRFLYQLTIQNEKSDFCTFRRITDPVLYESFHSASACQKLLLCPWVTPATKFKAITWTKPRSHDFVKGWSSQKI